MLIVRNKFKQLIINIRGSIKALLLKILKYIKDSIYNFYFILNLPVYISELLFLPDIRRKIKLNVVFRLLLVLSFILSLFFWVLPYVLYLIYGNNICLYILIGIFTVVILTIVIKQISLFFIATTWISSSRKLSDNWGGPRISLLFTKKSTNTRFRYLRTMVVQFIYIIISYSVINYSIYLIDINNFYVPSNMNVSIVDFVYSSLLTIVGGGRGDILPQTILTKSIVMSEIFIGLFWMLIIISAMVPFVFKMRDRKRKRRKYHQL